MPEPIADLGAVLRARRRERRLSLRDLADETGVSFNTLSRVERGHIPDLKNFHRIVEWLGMPPEAFLATSDDTPSTTSVIARHLMADRRLQPDAAAKITALVEEMYNALALKQPAVAVHLRSAKMFTPAAGAMLAEVLGEMQQNLLHEN
jgi:transcriptional regulator with XRE-family HTH domain